MPTYDFRNKDTGEVFEKIMKIAEKEQYLIDNPHIEQTLLAAPAMGDSVRLGLHKPDNGFKEVLQKIHSRAPGSQIKQNSSTQI
jgi:hypothetical protein